MKKTLAIATIVALTAVACQKENVGQDQTKTIKVAVETAPLTKMSIKDGAQPVWTVGEAAALISTSDYSVTATSKLTASDINGSKASFTFESVPQGNYYMISPSSTSISADGVVFSIAASQSQKELGISGSRACLVGGAKDGSEIAVGSETDYSAKLTLAGAILEINVFDSANPTGEEVKSVSVSAPAGKLSGNITVGWDGQVKSVAGSGSSVSVAVDNPEIVVADQASAKGIYAAVVPAKIEANESGTVTYTVTTDGSVYEFAMTEAVDWAAGVVSSVDIDLANATKVERQAPIMSSTHPEALGDLTMTETQPGVYTIEHVWLGGQDYSIYFAAGNSGFYYNALDGWVSSENPEFDIVYSSEPVALMVQQYGGKNYSEKYYTITLDTNTMKLKVLQDKGERFWLAGDPLSWTVETFEMDVDAANGIASWSGYLKTGNLRIYGENTSEDGWKGEVYYPDSSKGENGVSLNADGNKMWNITEAGYYSLEFHYNADPMTFTITKKESLDLKVNGKALTYSGNNEYSITTEFTKGEEFVLSGCKNLEYVMMDPDFLKDGKFNAKTGSYTFILHLGSYDASWTSDGQTPTNSWTLFKGINNGGIYSTMIIAGEGVANLTIKNCVGWTCESPNQPFMAEVDDNVYQFTGRYKESWWHLEPYDRWANTLKFKYYSNIWWGGEIAKGVNLVDNTGKITQLSSGDLSWADSNSKWDDWGTYRMTVDMNTEPHTVTFDKLQ